jgi:hypothetical protein
MLTMHPENTKNKSMLLLNLMLSLAAAGVLADTPVPAPAAPSPSSADLRAACADDAKTLCPDVQPGGGRIMQCLAQHKDKVSEGCKQAVIKARQAKKSTS